MKNTSGIQNIFTGNMLKITALILMTIDHTGAHLFPDMQILRIIGRLSYPIFAYMIAQGCEYTSDRKKYLSNMILLALLCQIVSYTVQGSLEMCAVVSFSLSIILIYLLDYMLDKRSTKSFFVSLFAILVVYFLSEMLPAALKNTDYSIDYGFFGILAPVFAYTGKTRMQKIAFFSFALVLVSVDLGTIQWYSLLAIPLLIMYNGKRGTAKLKNLFYIYYPAHLAAIYLIGLILR